MKYAITGATGGFGAAAIDHLLSFGVAPNSIVAIVRDGAKADALRTKNVDVRVAAYENLAALVAALSGVDRLLLVSGSEVGQRALQHANAIEAAKKAGVRHVVYTSLARASSSTNPLAGEHLATETALTSSGLDWTVLRNNWYFENYLPDLKAAIHSGTIAAAVKTGRVGAALKSEYAEAAARVLIASGHAGKIYELAGPLWTYGELANAASKAIGRPVSFVSVTEEQKKSALASFGLPEAVAGFYASLDTSIEAGTLEFASDDLKSLLGRAPRSLEDAVKTLASLAS